MLVHTSIGEIIVPKGSIVFVMNSGSEVTVFDLHDDAGKRLTVRVADRSMILRKPGEMVVLTRKAPRSFADLPEDNRVVGYRNAQGPTEHADTRIFVSEFSLPSALTTILPLRHMRASKLDVDRKATEKILKDAVILLRVGGPGVPYKSDRASGGRKFSPDELKDNVPPTASAPSRDRKRLGLDVTKTSRREQQQVQTQTEDSTSTREQAQEEAKTEKHDLSYGL